MTQGDLMHKAKQDAEFEAMLANALKARSNSAPRAGFHQRLTRSLRQHGDDSSARGPWWRPFSFLLGTATLATAMAGGSVALHHRPARAADARVASTSKPSAAYNVAARAEAAPGRRVQSIARIHEPAVTHLENSRKERRTGAALTEELPKLDTFPSIARQTDRPFGSGDPLQLVSSEAASAMLDLQQQQARPIVLTALNVNAPLFGDTP